MFKGSTEKTDPETIFAELKSRMPSVSVHVEAEEDPYFQWDGDGPDPSEEGFVPHEVTVFAQAILAGDLIEGTDALSGHYEKPGEADPGIGGYLPQMIEEALEDLLGTLTGESSSAIRDDLIRQINEGMAYLKDVMERRYAEQRG